MSNEINLETLAKQKNKSVDLQKHTQVTALQEVKIQSEELLPEQRAKIEEIKNNIDITDSQATVQYGISAQRNISQFSDTVLTQIRNKDSGYVGNMMTDLSIKVKEVGIDKLDNNSFTNKIPFLKTASRSIKKFMKRYETIEVQIDRIENELEKARMQMLKDISMFDTLYQKNLDYFRELQVYISAGEEKLTELREVTLPKLYAEVENSDNPMSSQLVRDFEDNVNRFEKKVHDLKISKTIAIQTAPQIKLIQNNDKLLVDKIQTAILNTIPLWKGQIVIALGLQRQQNALKMQREITDATNALLTKNSEILKQNTIDVARESERGIVDIETLKRVNENLISTIEETIKIQQEGHEARRNAETELLGIEQKLKETLLSVQNGNYGR
ncbi:MAG: toxic anion resistance protein [Acutalibacteraceae bacterium]